MMTNVQHHKTRAAGRMCQQFGGISAQSASVSKTLWRESVSAMESLGYGLAWSKTICAQCTSAEMKWSMGNSECADLSFQEQGGSRTIVSWQSF